MFTPPKHVTCHMSHVTCHVSHVTCHVSHVTCHMSLFYFLFFSDKVVELIGGGSVINGATPSSFNIACIACWFKSHDIFNIPLNIIPRNIFTGGLAALIKGCCQYFFGQLARVLADRKISLENFVKHNVWLISRYL